MGAMSFLFAAVIVCSSLALATQRADRWRWHRIFRPLATALILLMTQVGTPDKGEGPHLAISAGLALSLVGDVHLSRPGERILPGLACLGLALLSYTAAFRADVPALPSLLTYVPYLLVAALLSAAVWRGAGGMRLLVVASALLATAMAWVAGAPRDWGDYYGVYLAWKQGQIGAMLFVACGALVALDRYRRPIPDARGWALAAYYAAQIMVALSA